MRIPVTLARRKERLRRRYMAKRRNLRADRFERWSRRTCDRIRSHPEFNSAETVLMYYPVNRELDVRPLFSHLRKTGAQLVLPRLDPRVDRLTLYRVNSVDADLEPGSYDVPEPVPERCRRIEVVDLDLGLVPGLVFDRRGYRVGYGGGYYDRLLQERPPRLSTMGVCFSFQLVERLPVSNHDQPVQGIVSEHAVQSVSSDRNHGTG